MQNSTLPERGAAGRNKVSYIYRRFPFFTASVQLTNAHLQKETVFASLLNMCTCVYMCVQGSSSLSCMGLYCFNQRINSSCRTALCRSLPLPRIFLSLSRERARNQLFVLMNIMLLLVLAINNISRVRNILSWG